MARGHGEGTIRQRADGRFEGRVSWQATSGDGRWARHRRSVYGATRREVQDQLATLLRRHREGRLAAGRTPNVGEFLEAWLRWKEVEARKKVRPKTLKGYQDAIRLHIVPELGHHPIDRLTPDQVENCLTRRAGNPHNLSARSVANLRDVLRNALALAVRRRLVSDNVAKLAEAPPAEHFLGRYLTPDEARVLINAAEHDRLGALYALTVATGLRQGEALGLQWSDVDLDRRVVHVRHQLQRINGTLQLVDVKTESSRRAIRLPELTAERLRRHRLDQERERRWYARARVVDSDYVFTTTIGTPLDGTNVTRMFQRMVADAGLEKMRFHDLRHSAATLMRAAGVDMHTISAMLGHSSTRITSDLYTHVLPELVDDAAERMGAILGGRS